MRLFSFFVLGTMLLLAGCAHPTATPATYDRLADTRAEPLGPKSWIGNLKWYAEETDGRMTLVFRTMPKSQADAEYVALTQIVGSDKKVASFPSARRTLLRMRLPEGVTVSQVTYRADGLTAKTSEGDISVTMPLNRFGVIIDAVALDPAKPMQILFDCPWTLGNELVTPGPHEVNANFGTASWKQGNYTVAFRSRDVHRDFGGDVTDMIQSSESEPLRIAIAFNIDGDRAQADAGDLYLNADVAKAQSRADWSTYLDSCPVTHFPHGYHAHDPATNKDLNYTDEQLVTRQFWHWQVLLANCYDIPFNNMPAQLCPDKSTWFGSWSNDTPEGLRCLARTNQKDLARRALIEYVRVGITPEGDLTWYMHGTGVRGLGNPRDVGRLSHGVPAIVTAVEDYVEQTGDAGILEAAAGDGETLWQKLRTYMINVYHNRVTDPDGLVAWANLWEGGADDKVGPFFSKADIGAWCKAVENMGNADLKDFYAQNSRPVTNLYEQAFFLSALDAMQKLARRANDPEAAQFARQKFDRLTQTLHDKHWNETDGFYYDYDLTAGTLVRVKNQDTFYLLRYIHDPARDERILAHLHNPDEFALAYIPTLAKNEPGFKADGYWCGGYWPRESAAIAYGLAAAGHRDEAELILVKALMSADGKVVMENVNPITGRPSTPIVTMAYSAVLNVALADIHHQP